MHDDLALLASFEQPDWDPASSIEPELLKELNRLATDGDAGVEGNLFYFGKPDSIDAPPDPKRNGKRRNYQFFLLGCRSLLEIGFNAGHSALLALSCNPDLRYVGVDLGRHGYVARCSGLLRERFGDRIDLVTGDSREVMTRFHQRAPFDRYHVDGGHSIGVASTDLSNVWACAKHGDLVLMDDTQYERLDILCDYFLVQGMYEEVVPTKVWKKGPQRLLRVRKDVR
jgi:hypothetical protein